MTDFKRRTLCLSTGKQIKMYGNSMAIGSSLEIGEGSAPNIFSFIEQHPEEKSVTGNAASIPDEKLLKEKPEKKTSATVLNPHQLTATDVLEIADYNIRLWMDLKDNIRRHGVNNPKVFNSDALR